MHIFDTHIHVTCDTKIQEIFAFMDALHIQKGALLAMDQGLQGEKAGIKVSNEFVASLIHESEGRLFGIASISPETPGNLGEIFSNAIDNGLAGLKLYPHSGFYPNDKRLNSVFEIAEERNIPIFIHSGIKALCNHRMIFNNPIYIDEIAVQFPELKLIIMHAGYPWTREALVIAHGNENVYVDLTFLDVIDYTFEEGILKKITKQFVKTLGSKKIIWGSEGERLDLPLYEDEGLLRVKKNIEEIVSFDFLTEAEKEDIFYNNANKLFCSL